VSVKRAVGQAGIGHQRGNAGAVDAIALEPSTSRLDDAPTSGFPVLGAVARHAFSTCWTGPLAL
jgi:hypothetical protein